MYWTSQEKAVFGIVFFLMFVFQISSFLIFRESSSDGRSLLIGFNLVALFGMIFYAKWVWKITSFIVAVKKVTMYEIIFATLFSVCWLINQLI